MRKFPNTNNAFQFLFTQYVFMTLRYMLCERDGYHHHLMYDKQHDSWRLIFAALRGKPPVFHNIAWKITNTPRWEGLWKDLVNGGHRVLHVCMHVSDLSILPVAGNLIWLIELPETWSWLPLWTPGKIPNKYVQPSTISSQVKWSCQIKLLLIRLERCSQVHLRLLFPKQHLRLSSPYNLLLLLLLLLLQWGVRSLLFVLIGRQDRSRACQHQHLQRLVHPASPPGAFGIAPMDKPVQKYVLVNVPDAPAVEPGWNVECRGSKIVRKPVYFQEIEEKVDVTLAG